MMWSYGPSGMGWGWGWGGWLAMGLFMLIFWGVLVWAVVSLTRHWQSRPPSAPTEPPRGASGPRQIIDERFARGEIDEAEYRQRRDLLQTAQ